MIYYLYMICLFVVTIFSVSRQYHFGKARHEQDMIANMFADRAWRILRAGVREHVRKPVRTLVRIHACKDVRNKMYICDIIL